MLQRNKWRPPSIASKSLRPTEEEHNQAIFRKVRGILNKITPEKFDKLSEALLGLGLNTTALLKGVILLIFEKALEEPKYSSMYAQLCNKLSQRLPNFETPSLSATANDPASNTFCRLLLIKCSNEFENRRRATRRYGDGPLNEEDEEARAIAKSKMLGNIKFICELGRQLLVHENILHTCIKELCSKRKNEKLQNKVEDLECLCQIMKTVGRLLDTEKAKPLMDQYFERIEMYSEATRELPSRIVFMLRDVIELRDNKWVPRRIQHEQNPRTIGQIREEAARDFGLIPSLHFGGSSGSPFTFNSSYAQFSDIGLRAPLYGHPGMPMQAGRPGQRALDDMGYYANLAPHKGKQGSGIIQEDNFAGLGHTEARGRRHNNMNANPSLQHPSPSPSPPQVHVQGVMPYRGSSSQGTRRGGNERENNYQNNNRHRGGGDQRDRNVDSSGNLPPRMRRAPVGNALPQAPAQIGQRIQHAPGSIPIKQIMQPSHFGPNGEISLRPLQNSMVVKPMPVIQGKQNLTPEKQLPERQSPLLIKNLNSRNSPPSNNSDNTLVNNAKNTAASAPVLEKQNSKEDLLKKTIEVVSQLSDNSSLDDVISKMKELKIPKNCHSDLIITVVKQAIEKQTQERDTASKLLTKLKNENVISAHFFVVAFKSLLGQISDLETNVPRVKSHLAGFIARAVVDNIIDLRETLELVEDYYPMFMLILQQISAAQGQNYLSEQIEEHKIKLMDTLPQPDRNKNQLAEILRERELLYLSPLLKIELELQTLTAAPDVTSSGLYRWVKDNVDNSLQLTQGFVIVLVTSIIKLVVERANQTAAEQAVNGEQIQSSPSQISEVEKDHLKKFSGVLNAFLNEKPTLQLAALYALQSVCNDLSFPKGMLLRWFIALYDLEIIEEDAFLKWKEDINDEYPGKGQALFQVNSWLTWLAETEETDSEEEEEGVSAE